MYVWFLMAICYLFSRIVRYWNIHWNIENIVYGVRKYEKLDILQFRANFVTFRLNSENNDSFHVFCIALLD